MHKKILAFCIGFISTVYPGYSQTKKIEGLKVSIRQAQTDEQKLANLFKLCEQRLSLSTDTLHKYALAAKKLSMDATTDENKALADYYIANYYIKAGYLDSAMNLCDIQLAKLKNLKNNNHTWLKLSALKAQVFVKSNKYKEGLAEFYNTLTQAERTNDTAMQMIAKNGIGWVNMEMDQNREALKWLFHALETSTNPLLHQSNSNIYSNIAATYNALNKLDSATYFIKKAIDLSLKDENLFYLSNDLNIEADIFIHQNKPSLAEEPLTKAIKIREQIGDPFFIVSDLSQLALFYAQISQPQKGIKASLKGIEMAKKFQLASKLPYLQFALAQNFKAAGDYLKYGETLEKVLSLKDSVYQLNSEQELAEIKASYNQQKQENLIMQQKLALNKKNTLIYVSLIILFFGIVISGIIFSNYKRKQKLIVERIKEEEKRKAVEAVQIAEENERKRISADLHDNLGAYASAISSNVDDLIAANGAVNQSMIQNIKSNADDILNSLNETIWVLKRTEIHLTSVSDRFKNYVSRIHDTYPEFSININEHISKDITLSPESALHMLRIMQEAFHNAIKHSKGDCITIEIFSDSEIQIRISDNGEGIKCTNNTNGNGISNMEKRARNNGWNLTLKNAAMRGTVVELVVNRE